MFLRYCIPFSLFAPILLLGCGASTPGPSNPAEGSTPTDGTTSDSETTGISDSSGLAGEGLSDPSDPADPSAPASKPSADPYADMPHPPVKDSGRHQLDGSDVLEVVEAYRPHLRELCWIPRMKANTKGQKQVRVAIQVDVSKEGEVKSIRAAGGHQYEGLTGCVEEHAKRWHFPRAKQDSSLMFPIVFNRDEFTEIRVD